MRYSHPDIQLFEYLNGAADAEGGQVIEAHLSICEECASVAAVVRALKEAASGSSGKGQAQISNLRSRISGEHPDISELASFFYAKARRAESSSVATHVALCGSCREAIAQYARAERAAAEYKPAKEATGGVPAKAWEMIRDWEESGFAQVRPASEVLGDELLVRLAWLLKEREPTEQRKSFADNALRDHAIRSNVPRASGSQPNDRPERVPVVVVSRSGELRTVEMFEQIIDSGGTIVLRHVEGSERFDNKAVHLLLDFGEKEPVVVSELVRKDRVRMPQSLAREDQPRRTDYLIIED